MAITPPDPAPQSGDRPALSEQRLRALLDHSTDSIALIDAENRILYLSPAVEAIEGYKPEELIGHNGTENTHPDDLPLVQAVVEKLLAEPGKPVPVLWRRRHKDGRWLWLEGMATNLLDDPAVGAILTSYRDVSERVRVEETLRASEERFRVLEQNSWDAVHLLSADGVILYESPSVFRVLGYRPEDLVGRNSFELLHPDDLAVMAERFAPLATTPGVSLTAETRVLHKDGSWRWMDCVATNLLEHPAVRAIAVNYRDITDRKLAEEDIRRSEARYRTLFDTLTEGFCTIEMIFDDQGQPVDYRFLEVNPAFERQTGLHDAQGKLMRDLAPDHEPHWFRIYGKVALTGETIQFENEAKALGRHYAVCAYRVGGPGSRKVAILFNDITARKQTEQALRESEARLRFLNELGDATRTLASAQQIMEVTTRLLGQHLHTSRCAYTDVEEDGERFTILHDYTDGCASTVGDYGLSAFGARTVAKLHRGGTLVIRDASRELEPGAGGEAFAALGIQAIITCPLLRDGVLRAMMSVHQTAPRDWKPDEVALVQDVVERCWATLERRTAEEKLQQLNAELERRVNERTAQLQDANKELEAFSYSVSHDLRAPLRAVDGFSQIVLDEFAPGLPDEAQRLLHLIRDAGRRMGNLIDDLLALARLNRQDLKRQLFDTGSVVRESLTELGAPLPGRDIELRLAELPPSSGDPALLKQVWLNLLSNAFKYTRKRERAVIEIGSTRIDGRETFFVRDNGTGFDMRYAGKLFGVFQRLHFQEDYEGTGVGLAIVQRIVERHGGRVWADAAEDRGATFYFTLEGEAPP